MSLAESYSVRKSTVDPDVEVSSDTFLSQNTYNKGMSRGTRYTNLASDTKAENTSKGKTLEHPSRFSATDAAREKLSRKRRLEADSESEVLEKEDDECRLQKGFVRSQNMTSLSGISQKNLSKYSNDHFNKFITEKYLQESILVENPVPLSLHPPRKMDEFMRDLIFEKIAGILEEAAASNLVKMQQKLLEVMEPLSKVWTTVNSYFEQK